MGRNGPRLPGQLLRDGLYPRARPSEKAQPPTWSGFRFRRLPGEAPAIDPASVRRFEAVGSLASALARDSRDVDKLKVEGLAIREVAEVNGRPARTEVVVGLREPADSVRVFAGEIKDEPGRRGSSIAFEKLSSFDPGLREGVPATLTSLTYVPSWRGFFLLTATEDKENAFHGNTLWFLRDDEIPNSGPAKPDRAYDFGVP